MKLVVQRVTEASVAVEGAIHGKIGQGLVVFVCIEKGDSESTVEHYARKVSDLRIFGDDAGKMNLSIKDVSGRALVISQFTLAGDVEKGRRPSFETAAPPDEADRLYNHFAETLRKESVPVVTGVFRAMMQISLVNDGPVTILLGGRKEPVR